MKPRTPPPMKPHYSDVMVDLETLGRTPCAVVLSIGAAKFAPFHSGVGPTFHMTLKIAPQVEAERVIEPETAAWWREQNSELYQSMLDDPLKQHPRIALDLFRQFLEADGVPADQWRIWGNGAAFDNVILADLHRSFGLQPCWSFRNDRCYRTWKSMYPMISPVRPMNPHVAVDDAIAQVRTLNLIMEQWRRAETLHEQYQERKEKRRNAEDASPAKMKGGY